MASNTGILLVAFLLFTLLPLFASAFFPFPDLPGILGPRQDFIEPRIDKVPGLDNGNNGDDSVAFWEPGTDEQPPKQDKPEPEPNPEEGPGNQTPIDESKPGKDAGHGNETPIDESKPRKEGLREGFYAKSCPRAEQIVKETIHKHFAKDPSLAAALVRLLFHDCFVTGCDASILLDQTPTGEEVEKTAIHNGKFIRGLEAIDDIKSELEAECPGIVSCADILVFASRDSLVFTGVPPYQVAAGRRDGQASLAKNVQDNLPLPDDSAEKIIQLFQKKGMSLEEVVVLIGAHSIGSAHCTIVGGRFRDPNKAKDIDPGYLFKMQILAVCRNETQDIAFDPYSQQKMDSHFYKELLTKQALLESDHNLAKDPRTNSVMTKLVDNQTGWLAKFTRTVTKLGEVEVLTGNQGEIRKQCRAVN